MNCLAENIPFSKLNNNEFYVSVKKGVINSNKKNVEFSPSEYQQKIFDKLNSAINNNAFGLDIDEDDDCEAINCKFYNIDDFSSENFHPTKTFYLTLEHQ